MLKHIEEMWSKRPEHVFDGTVLACSGYRYDDGKLLVECYLTEYKYVYSLRSHIMPVAVIGICIDPNGKTIVSVRNKDKEVVTTTRMILDQV